jgi:hypothetical protein
MKRFGSRHTGDGFSVSINISVKSSFKHYSAGTEISLKAYFLSGYHPGCAKSSQSALEVIVMSASLAPG